ncbi:hypothetical protein [Peribacillus cavernae]|nr:hypothetical protein [Peribacillus cavernae]MDQ0221143.1 hypothetical protein [Peribacillus cavernae]
MRLATVEKDGKETAALVTENGLLPNTIVSKKDGQNWLTGQFYSD